MKKTIALILLVSLILSVLVFTACSSIDSTNTNEDEGNVADTAEEAVDGVLSDELIDADDSVEIGEMI